jgi:hypothetical protein
MPLVAAARRRVCRVGGAEAFDFVRPGDYT